MKTCTKCGVEKPLDQFSRKLNGLQSKCKSCVKLFNREHYEKNRRERIANQKEYYLANAESIKQYKKEWRKQNPELIREYYLERHYGITVKQFDELLEKQKGNCAICFSELPKSHHTHVDHDHKTGAVRGILCHGCNTGIGLFKENVTSLQSAIQYLQRNQGNQ